MSHDVSPVTPESVPAAQAREYYSPFNDDAAFKSPRASYGTSDVPVTRYSGIPDLSERRLSSAADHARMPSRASQAPEWIPPEMSRSGESGLIHPVVNAGSSEKMFCVPRHECLPEVYEKQPAGAEEKKRGGIKMWIVALVLAAALIIAIGIGLGVGLGLGLNRSNLKNGGSVAGGSASSSPSTADAPVSPTAGITVQPRSSGTSSPQTVMTRKASTANTPTFASPTAVAQAFLNLQIPTVSLGNFDNEMVTLGLAPRPGGTATTTVTLPMLSPAPTGGLVSASIFHSSDFSPSAYVATSTYVMADLNTAQGVAAVDCPQAESAVYVADDGAVFQKFCYADIFGAPNVGTTVANSLDNCLDQCEQALGKGNCVGVSFGANITLAMIDQQANCWYKSNPSKITPGDWQQSVALLIGWKV